MEFHHIVPHDDVDGEAGSEDHPVSPDPPIWSEVNMKFKSIEILPCFMI